MRIVYIPKYRHWHAVMRGISRHQLHIPSRSRMNMIWSNKLDISVTDEQSKKCNMHFGTRFNGHLKLHQESMLSPLNPRLSQAWSAGVWISGQHQQYGTSSEPMALSKV